MPPHNKEVRPGYQWVAVTPSDTVDLTETCRSLYVSSSGTVSLVDASGATVSGINAYQGGYLLVNCRRVNSTGTTATLFAIY